jgi:hypothetical protein
MLFDETHQKILEAVTISKTWYHGTTADFQKFDYQHVYNENSNAQYGPGFYLTDSPEIARGYANGNGYLLIINLTRKGRIANQETKPKKISVEKYIQRMPDKEDVLSNWDESPHRAASLLQQSLEENNDTLLEMVQSVWSDCYRGHEPYFVRCLVNRSLIDGILVPQQNGVNFLIAYNPDVLKIVDVQRIGS